jgi:U2 small nuclear ribonucleoprotein B''
LSDTSSDKTS